MKNKILSIVLMAILFMPAQISLAEEQSVMGEELPAMEEVSNIEENTVQKLDEDISSSENISYKSPAIPHKNPISKRKLIKKFLIAMFAVGLSSFALYFSLTVYNKFKTNVEPKVKTPEGETPLATPKDFESAVKTFLEKTKW